MSATARPDRASGTLETPQRWGGRGAIVWIAIVAFAWWDAFHRAYTGMDGSANERALMVSATAAVATKLGGHALEATAYAGWWRLRGAALPWLTLFLWIVTYSMLDVFALWMMHASAPPLSNAVLVAILAGPAALRDRLPGVSLGLWTAFGASGAFALLRIVATTDRQRRMTGRGWREPVALTLALWLATRLIQWWGVDLLRGRSVPPM